MIVADTNLIAYTFIPGPHTPLAEAVATRDSDWGVPPLWRSEFRNALSLYVRQGHLVLAAAIQAMAEAEELLVKNEREVSSEAVLRLADQSGRTAYDCEFVHVAQELGVPLVTADKQLLRSFPSVAISLEDFVR